MYNCPSQATWLCRVPCTIFNAACCVLVPHAGPSVTVDQRCGSSSSSELKYYWFFVVSIDCKANWCISSELFIVFGFCRVRRKNRGQSPKESKGFRLGLRLLMNLMSCTLRFQARIPARLVAWIDHQTPGGGPSMAPWSQWAELWPNLGTFPQRIL
jgi:hypothetical protein